MLEEQWTGKFPTRLSSYIEENRHHKRTSRGSSDDLRQRERTFGINCRIKAANLFERRVDRAQNSCGCNVNFNRHWTRLTVKYVTAELRIEIH